MLKLKNPIPALTAGAYVITHAVLDIARNCYLYYGDYESCSELEFCNNNYFVVSL